MLVFLDTEFTNFKSLNLISIGLVSQCGREFYAELTDYHRDSCSDFVKENVLPYLGLATGCECNRAELAIKLRSWFANLNEPATVVFDFQGDWRLLISAMGSQAVDVAHLNFGEQLHLENEVLVHPVFVEAQDQSYKQGLPIHHALADARALKNGYEVWSLYMTQNI